MFKKLTILLAILAIAAPAFALVVSKDGQTLPQNSTPVDQPLSSRADVEFSTGGAMNTPATLSGNAAGWAYYFAHVYTNNSGFDLNLLELGFPTNENSADPIVMPVEWTISLNNSDVYSVINPYTFAWDGLGEFTPVGIIDTAPPTDYSIVDISADGLVLLDGQSMVWGYENAGLGGMIDFNGEVTYGWYVDFWDVDDSYGRTALQQFTADYADTPTEDSSFSSVKSLY